MTALQDQPGVVIPLNRKVKEALLRKPIPINTAVVTSFVFATVINFVIAALIVGHVPYGIMAKTPGLITAYGIYLATTLTVRRPAG